MAQREMMRAYVLHGKDNASWQEVPVPEIGDYDALVEVKAAAVCTTDLENLHTAAFPNAIGKAMGHEAVGVVYQVGKYVQDFKPGDRVIIPVDWGNFRHPRAMYREAKFYQPNSPYWSPTGCHGHFAQYSKVFDADQMLAKIPDGVSDLEAVMIPDMLGTGFTGINKLNIQFGDTVVVLGIGPVGLMGVLGAQLRGAGRIIAVGGRELTKKIAREYGATDIVDYHDGEVKEQILALVGEELIDSVLIASGGSASEQITLAFELVRPGGSICNVTAWADQDSFTIPLSAVSRGVRDKSFFTSLVEPGRALTENYLRLCRFGKVDLTKIATPVFNGGWDDLEAAIAAMDSKAPDIIKPVVLIP